MSIGCGSCLELWDFPDNVDDILLIDQDKRALASAKERLEVPNNCRVEYLEENLLKFVLKPRAQLIGTRTLVYLFGLFDYFTVKNGARMIPNIWKYVAPGGMMVVTNAHPNNPTKTWMEWGGDWYLDYKNQDTLTEMVSGLPGASSVEFETDSLGVYQYAKITKTV